MDTHLCCGGVPLEVHRADIADGRVPPGRVVEPFNVVKCVGAGRCCMDRAGGLAGRAAVGGLPLFDCWVLFLPFKLNQDRRHHIPKQKRKVMNSAAYDAALRQRASLTVWFTDDAIEGWRAEPRTTAGGQRWYSLWRS